MATNQAIVDELLRLTREHGGELRPQVVVDAAREESSPLHAMFDWDDSTAAEKYRLWQARTIIRVTVQYQPLGNREPVLTRVFASLTSHREDDSGYRVMVDVMGDVDLRAQLLADARAEMKRFAAKYRHLVELAGVFAAMDDALGVSDTPSLFPADERESVNA